jgi:hypothetical protein
MTSLIETGLKDVGINYLSWRETLVTKFDV